MILKINRRIDFLKPTISQDFHDSTKLSVLIQEPNPKKWPETWKKVFYKGYPRLPVINLPQPHLNSKVSFVDVLQKRRSVRSFSKEQLTVKELSNLLYYSAGAKPKDEWGERKRFYPSGGGRYPLELYPIVSNVDGIKYGIYHYYVKTHSLEVLLNSRFRKSLFSNIGQKWAKNAAVLFIISAVFHRTEIKYGHRGYRHVLTEVGHMSQNIYLVSAALGLGCCSIGGYVDDEINNLLDFDGISESVLVITAIGKTK